MANQPSVSDLLDSILQTAGQQYSDATNNAKTFGDMLAERRAFVQAGENKVGDQVQAAENSGSNGVPLSPAHMETPMFNYHTDNANQTAALSQDVGNYQNQANSILGTIMNYAAQKSGQGIQQSQLNLDAAKYGLQSDGKGGYSYGSNGGDPVAQVSASGGQDLLAGLGPDDQHALAAQIIAAGGVGNWRANHSNGLSSQDADQLQGTNTTLQQITRLQNKLQDPNSGLQKVFGNPVTSNLVRVALATNNSSMLKTLGLSDEDIAALSDLTGFGVQGERQLVGGQRLSSYFGNKLGPAMPSLDKNPQVNLELLNNSKQNILKGLESYAKEKGYKSMAQVPNIDPTTLGTPMKSPDGKTAIITDPQEVEMALKNGWKQL